MGLLDQLALHAAGVAGSFQQGRLKGEAVKYDRDQEERQRQDRLAQQALEQAILQKRETRAEALSQAQMDELNATAAERRARATGTGMYAPKPLVPKPGPLTPWAKEGFPDEASYLKFAGREAQAKHIRDAGSGEKPAKQIPASAVGHIADWKSLGDATDNAMGAFFDRDPKTGAMTPNKVSATGFFEGRLAGIKGQLGIGDPTAVAARSKLANIGTALGKLRSGGAITPSEFERLAPLIPDKNDDEDTVRTKLQELKSYLDQVVNRQVETFNESGYNTAGLEGGHAPTSAPRKSNPLYSKYGLEPKAP